MPFSIVRNNIVNMQTDAIVNTANPRPVIGAGTDAAVHAKAGPRLLEARKAVGNIPRGQSAVTPAFGLNAEYVIHTVGPVWCGGDRNEGETLQSCYQSALRLAAEKGCRSVAFPLISAGNYGFPKDLALQTAVSAISSFLADHEMTVYLVVFDKSAYVLSEKLFHEVESYIDENLVMELSQIEYGEGKAEYDRRRILEKEEAAVYSCPDRNNLMMVCETHSSSENNTFSQIRLEKLMDSVGETFSEALIRMIDQRGLKDPEVYKKANISRQLFSKIRNNRDYQPKKTTALAFAVALRLDLDETRELLGRAGYLLSRSSKFDIIVEYFIANKNYDIFELNEVLFAFTDQILGS